MWRSTHVHVGIGLSALLLASCGPAVSGRLRIRHPPDGAYTSGDSVVVSWAGGDAESVRLCEDLSCAAVVRAGPDECRSDEATFRSLARGPYVLEVIAGARRQVRELYVGGRSSPRSLFRRNVDLSGDGLADVAWVAPTGECSACLHIIEGNADRTLAVSRPCICVDQASDALGSSAERWTDWVAARSVGDINADGRHDLLLSRIVGDVDRAVVVILSTPAGFSARPLNAAAPLTQLGMMGLDDMDGDGVDDLRVLAELDRGLTRLGRYDWIDDVIVWGQQVELAQRGGRHWLGGSDGGGTWIVWGSHEGALSRTEHGAGASRWSLPVAFQPALPSAVAIVDGRAIDFDGDGLRDGISQFEAAGGYETVVFPSSGPARAVLHGAAVDALANWRSAMGSGDVDGDGVDEVAAWDYDLEPDDVNTDGGPDALLGLATCDSAGCRAHEGAVWRVGEDSRLVGFGSIGDFDGDACGDLALIEHGWSVDRGRLRVLFGGCAGRPALEPVDLPLDHAVDAVLVSF